MAEKDSWGSQHVKQNIKWDDLERELLGHGAAAITWKTNVNDGTELWEPYLSDGPRPPSPVDQEGWRNPLHPPHLNPWRRPPNPHDQENGCSQQPNPKTNVNDGTDLLKPYLSDGPRPPSPVDQEEWRNPLHPYHRKPWRGPPIPHDQENACSQQPNPNDRCSRTESVATIVAETTAESEREIIGEPSARPTSLLLYALNYMNDVAYRMLFKRKH